MQPEQPAPYQAPQYSPVQARPSETAASALPVVPTEWPGAFGILKHSKKVIMTNPWAILCLNVLALIAGAANNVPSGLRKGDLSWLAWVGLLLSTWFTLGLTVLYLAAARNEKAGVFAALRQAGSVYIKGLVASILTFAISLISLLLLIIPALFVIPRLALVNYFVVDQKLGPLAAIRASWKATYGNTLKVWGITAVTVLFAILCLVLIGIYLLFIYQASVVLLYLYATRQEAPATGPLSMAQPVPPPTS